LSPLCYLLEIETKGMTLQFSKMKLQSATSVLVQINMETSCSHVKMFGQFKEIWNFAAFQNVRCYLALRGSIIYRINTCAHYVAHVLISHCHHRLNLECKSEKENYIKHELQHFSMILFCFIFL